MMMVHIYLADVCAMNSEDTTRTFNRIHVYRNGGTMRADNFYLTLQMFAEQ
jgi:hypothetical protein